ncbi:MAG TPA: LPS export ABC transporter permease LptF [Pseudomonadales bacterium]|nr:LPS export ABC transporter permease LptF [Pseudomonadales bacterium]
MILFRYFAREVFSTMAAVAGIVLVISMGWRFNQYLTEAANGLWTKDVLFLIMAYRLPGFLELILPISFFLALMLAYGRLYVDSEMVVLHACGMSTARLIEMTLALSVFVMILTAMMTMWLKPAGESRVEQIMTGQQNLTEFDTLVPGRFQTLRSGKRVTYTESVDDSGNLKNLFMNEYKDSRFFGPKDVITIDAQTGDAIVDPNGNRFLVLKNGTRYSGKPGDKSYRVIRYQEYGQLVEKENHRYHYGWKSAIPTRELLDDATPANVSELNWRISIILMVPIIAIMAIPMSRVNPRQGRFTRLVPGMLFCFIYVISLSAARAGMEKGQLPTWPGLWWVHAIFISFIWLLYNMEKLARPLQRLIPWRTKA